MTFKLRSELRGNHIYTTFFSGTGDTLANTGYLFQDIGEWQLFGAMLKLGETAANKNIHRVNVILEGDEKIIEELADRE